MKPIYKKIYNILWMNILQPKFCDNLDFHFCDILLMEAFGIGEDDVI